jgi:uncharacterized membrane protein
MFTLLFQLWLYLEAERTKRHFRADKEQWGVPRMVAARQAAARDLRRLGHALIVLDALLIGLALVVIGGM